MSNLTYSYHVATTRFVSLSLRWSLCTAAVAITKIALLQVVLIGQQMRTKETDRWFAGPAARRRLRIVECDDAAHHVEYPMILWQAHLH